MSRRGFYLAVGFLWATLLGAGAGLAAAAIAAGAAWIYLFGDSTWPDWTSWAIPGVGAVVGLTTFAASMIVTRIVANRYDVAGSEVANKKDGSVLAWVLLLLGLAVAGGVAWQGYGRQEDIQKAREQTAAADRYFPVLLSQTHRIAGIAVDWPGGGRDGSAAVTLDGLREGAYRLDWQVRDALYEKPLLKGGETLQLTAGTRVLEIDLPAQGVVDGYRLLLSRQDANIMVDEPFVLEVQLAPIPSEHETAQMPANEVHNLAIGWSPLLHRSSVEFTVRFFLYGDRLSWE
ncbi:MAG: hypothetical protein OEN55_02745 [Alphaproteobacteria bacterium]|nr:hypothetical protein [Alphaproteobacteria bacterium]